MASRRAAPSKAATGRFDPTALSLAELNERLKLGPNCKLPEGWIAGRPPQRPLPIDKCISNFLAKGRKPVLRPPKDLREQHPLGACPYAMARSAVAHAAVRASWHEIKAENRSSIVAALKHLKDEGPKLRDALKRTGQALGVLMHASEYNDFRIPHLKTLTDAVVRSVIFLESTRPDIIERHLELSQHTGNVWRLSFVRGLFGSWWYLTGRDPVASAGPFQRFVIAAWCSLSPRASPDDADWRSSIQTCLKRSRPGDWRLEPQMSSIHVRDTAAAISAALDDFVEMCELDDRLAALKRRLGLNLHSAD